MQRKEDRRLEQRAIRATQAEQRKAIEAATIEDGLYRVRVVDPSGIEQEFTARPGAPYLDFDGVKMVWIPTQLGVAPGPVQMMSVERIGE